MWTGALVVLGLVAATLRLMLVLSLSIDGRAFGAVVRKLLVAGDVLRCERLCEAARAPLTDAVRETLREVARAPAGPDRASLEGAFLRGFRSSSTRIDATRWVPWAVALFVGAGLAISFAQATVSRAQGAVAALSVVAVLLTSQRLSRMLAEATIVRDDVVALLLAPREPYRLSIEAEPAAEAPADGDSGSTQRDEINRGT